MPEFKIKSTEEGTSKYDVLYEGKVVESFSTGDWKVPDFKSGWSREDWFTNDELPWGILFTILYCGGRLDRLTGFDPVGRKFKDCIRELLHDMPADRVNSVRRKIGERDIGEFCFCSNLWLFDDAKNYYGLPEPLDRTSEKFKVYQNLSSFIRSKEVEVSMINDAISQSENEHMTGLRARLLRVESAATFTEIHDEISAEYRILSELINREKLEKDFGEPPFLDIEGATFLKNGRDLLVEGNAMHHCVASYVDKVLGGNSWIYHLEDGKSRGTLEIGVSGETIQFKGPHNQQPTDVVQEIARKLVSSSNANPNFGLKAKTKKSTKKG